ncbi:hypothetical protein ACEXQB_005545 [Herbiconiux sp. P18]|uniref:hypothetical protein n=1 Tax=Herbiconiux liangxiaofengii TaxID=3342795 RepID=UPI0035BC25DE
MSRWQINRPGNLAPRTKPLSQRPRAARSARASGASVRPAGAAEGGGRQKRLSVLAVAAGVVAVLVVLGVGAVVGVGLIGSATSAGGPFGPAAPAATASAEPDSELVPAVYGQTVTYDDGLQISVSEPQSFSPSPAASGADQAANVAVTVTVYNGRDVAFDPVTFTSVVSAGVNGSPIVDSNNGMTGLPPTTSIGVGETFTYVEAYSVADADDVAYVVTPSPEYFPARFSR